MAINNSNVRGHLYTDSEKNVAVFISLSIFLEAGLLNSCNQLKNYETFPKCLLTFLPQRVIKFHFMLLVLLS